MNVKKTRLKDSDIKKFTLVKHLKGVLLVVKTESDDKRIGLMHVSNDHAIMQLTRYRIKSKAGKQTTATTISMRHPDGTAAVNFSITDVGLKLLYQMITLYKTKEVIEKPARCKLTDGDGGEISEPITTVTVKFPRGMEGGD